MIHYHWLENGRKGPVVTSAADAERELRDRASELVLEKQHQGAGVEMAPLPGGGVVVIWDDRYVRGRSIIETATCMIDHGVEAAAGEELMRGRAEAWLFGADDYGLWVLPGGYPLQSGPIPARLGVRETTGLLLRNAGVTGHLVTLHGTSDRDEDGCIIATHAAVVDCPAGSDGGPGILHHWPDAVPLGWDLFEEVDRPAPHHPVEAPERILYVDVAVHAARHLAWLIMTDSDERAAMPPLVRQHLELLRPELFKRYERGEVAA